MTCGVNIFVLQITFEVREKYLSCGKVLLLFLIVLSVIKLTVVINHATTLVNYVKNLNKYCYVKVTAIYRRTY
jgi:hypothetical protein